MNVCEVKSSASSTLHFVRAASRRHRSFRILFIFRRATADAMARLVLIAGAVLLLAQFAFAWRPGVVDPMPHRFYGAKVSEHRLDVCVGKIFVNHDGHDRA